MLDLYLNNPFGLIYLALVILCAPLISFILIAVIPAFFEAFSEGARKDSKNKKNADPDNTES